MTGKTQPLNMSNSIFQNADKERWFRFSEIVYQAFFT